MKPTKKPADRTYVPQSAEEAAKLLQQIGIDRRELDAIQYKLNAKVERVKAEAEYEAAPLRNRLAELTRGLEIWATANRQALTQGKTKTITLASGVLRWKLSPPAIKLTKPTEVLAVIRELGLAQFLRTKVEIDKEALLKAPDQAAKIPGVAIVQAETFEAEPTGLALSQAGG